MFYKLPESGERAMVPYKSMNPYQKIALWLGEFINLLFTIARFFLYDRSNDGTLTLAIVLFFLFSGVIYLLSYVEPWQVTLWKKTYKEESLEKQVSAGVFVFPTLSAFLLIFAFIALGFNVLYAYFVYVIGILMISISLAQFDMMKK